MKVLVINASPNMDRGNTARILTPFVDGMRSAGAEVEVICTKKLKINACCGQAHCWLKTPGQCRQNDDMQAVYPKLREADVWVLAAPLYVDGFPGPMKMFLDRILPLAEPFFEIRKGRCRHPLRAGVEAGKIVLVSNCGFWEMENFEPLVAHVKAICENINCEFVGALLRPHGPALAGLMKYNYPFISAVLYKDVLEAAMAAGRQLAKEGVISPELLRKVSRNLLPRAAYVAMANRDFRKMENDRKK